jgi:cytochrome b
VKVWDLPTRLVHWGIVILVPLSWWSAHSDHLPWHRLSGYAILGLLIFRLAWGFAGASSARFRVFIAGPGAVRAYLGGRFGAFVGHNPLGGWSVCAMLAALAVQVGLGLFSTDEDSLEPGPLSRFLSFDDSRAVAHVHHLWFWVVVGLAALHIVAVAVHAARGRNLTGAMITGRTPLPAGTSAPRLAPAWRAIALAVAAAAVAAFIGHGLRL